jgi:glycosyltransferase involved in cell wall biosynthesis
MVFVGGLGWFPNLDAMRYFCDSVFPLVLHECPEANLTVVGKNPDERAARSIAAHPGVRLTGMIDDIRDTVSAAAVYVVPLRMGGGTRLKILDALSMGKAIVTTALGCEGLEVIHGEHLLIADEPQTFAREVLRLLANPDLAVELGRRGRELVRKRYEWKVIAEAMEEVYAGCRQRRAED